MIFIKPVMPIAKTFDSGISRKLSLRLSCLWNAQIIEAQVSRNSRLIMPMKIFFSFCNISPFSKALAPPFIILRNRMKLRKIKGDYTRFVI